MDISTTCNGVWYQTDGPEEHGLLVVRVSPGGRRSEVCVQRTIYLRVFHG